MANDLLVDGGRLRRKRCVDVNAVIQVVALVIRNEVRNLLWRTATQDPLLRSE
jgi:hypothetical protein